MIRLSANRKTNTPLQRGASMVEYALLVALVALIAIPSIRMFGATLDESLVNTTHQVAAAGGIVQCEPGSSIHPACLAD